MKKQPMKQEQIFASYFSDIALIYRIYQQLKKNNFNIKATNPVKKWAKGVKREFSEEIQMTGKSMRKC